jgi:ABC-type Fe3+-siderophore transport system permease subunit
MTLALLGAAAFGAVIGWMTYRTMAQEYKAEWSDIATVIATVGSAAVLSLFPAQTDLFAAYAVGLFIGFFGYFLFYLIIARAGGVSWLDILTGEETGIYVMADTKTPADDD